MTDAAPYNPLDKKNLGASVAEAMLGRRPRPLGHQDSFHGAGKGRYQGMRPRWDVLHPGRTWAEKCGPRPETAEQIEREIRAHLEQTQPPAHAHFYAEQRRGAYTVERS